MNSKLIRGVQYAAWAYFFLYLDINLNRFSLLPNAVGWYLLSRAVTALEEETNKTARIDLVDEWEALLNQEMPFIPLWFSYALHVQSKTVTGIDYAAAACCNENVWQWEMTQA